MSQKKPLELPIVEPVTVQELAYNLRLIPSPSSPCPEHEVEFLTRLIATARQEAENYTGRYWVEQGFKETFSSFATVDSTRVSEVISVDYYDVNNILTTLPTEMYYVTVEQIRFTENVVLPDVYPRLDAVTVYYKVGSTLIPEPVKHAIILIASHFYENREATGIGEVKEIPLSYRWLLDSYREIIV